MDSGSGGRVNTGLLLAPSLRVRCFITGVYIKSVFCWLFLLCETGIAAVSPPMEASWRSLIPPERRAMVLGTTGDYGGYLFQMLRLCWAKLLDYFFTPKSRPLQPWQHEIDDRLG
jgi:hypothetical protein